MINWQGIDFPAGTKEWKRFGKINETIALNILQVPNDEMKMSHAYKSKYNHTRKNQVVLSMISDGKKWHYTALKSEITEDGFNRPIKSLSRLFRGITSNHDGDFYCLNCLHPFRTDNALKKHERLCENNDYCSVEMPTKLNMTLSSYSLDLGCSFDSKEDKYSFYRGNDCIKKFCSELKGLGTKVVIFNR